MLRALEAIKVELRERIQFFNDHQRLVEAQRIEQRTRFDIEMLDQLGFCKGIENYSRHLSGRKPGEPPPTLLDYLPKNVIVFIDESHVTIGQTGGMYKATVRARKTSLITASGCHLRSTTGRSNLMSSSADAAPDRLRLRNAGGPEKTHQGRWSSRWCAHRPGRSEVIVRAASTQVDDLLSEIRKRVRSRAGVGDDADQAHGRGPDRLPPVKTV